MTMTEGHLRSIVKAATWRILGTCATIGIVFALSGNAIISFSIGFLDILVKSILYYLHERTWNGIEWGRKR